MQDLINIFELPARGDRPSVSIAEVWKEVDSNDYEIIFLFDDSVKNLKFDEDKDVEKYIRKYASNHKTELLEYMNSRYYAYDLNGLIESLGGREDERK